MNATNPLTINEVKTLDELFRCREALVAIRKSVSKIVATLFSNQDEIRRELYAEVSAALVKHLGGTKIRNKKFLTSSNRLGWLSIFARNISRHWIADRVRQSLGDKRVQEALQKQYLPAETFEKYQERAREFAESLAFDLHQFAGKRRPRIVDEFEEIQAAYERIEDVADPDETDEPDEPTLTDTLEDTRLSVLRHALTRLPKRDRTFALAYVERERGCPHTPAERKRFSRLAMRLRDSVSRFSPKVGI